MDYEPFITIVEQAIGDQATSDGDAFLATRATLQTLGERIDPGQARQLASQLPAEIAPWVATQTPARRFDAVDTSPASVRFPSRVRTKRSASAAAATPCG